MGLASRLAATLRCIGGGALFLSVLTHGAAAQDDRGWTMVTYAEGRQIFGGTYRTRDDCHARQSEMAIEAARENLAAEREANSIRRRYEQSDNPLDRLRMEARYRDVYATYARSLRRYNNLVESTRCEQR